MSGIVVALALVLVYLLVGFLAATASVRHKWDGPPTFVWIPLWPIGIVVALATYAERWAKRLGGCQ